VSELWIDYAGHVLEAYLVEGSDPLVMRGRTLRCPTDNCGEILSAHHLNTPWEQEVTREEYERGEVVGWSRIPSRDRIQYPFDEDAVERVAIALWKNLAGRAYTDLGWDAMSESFQREWRGRAMGALDAALGMESDGG
jgi:hypothetical protein